MSSAAGSQPWRLGNNHSDAQWQSKMRRRGWTTEQISEAIAHGMRFLAVNLVHPDNRATRYVHPVTGRLLVLDDVTNEILLGGDGYVC